MEAGNRNGNWAAPAPLNPIARAEKGWISTIPITGQPEFDMHYSLTVPQVFRVNGNYSGEYFLFEMRKFDQNMTIGSVSVPDYNNSYFMPIAHSSNLTDVIETQGILVWRVKSFYPAGNYESSGLIYASGLYGMTYPDRIASETDAGDLFPGTANVKVISPWSDSRDPYMTSGGAPNNVFVPNTGRSTNVAMEVLSEQSSGFRIKLFATNPQDASPSKPQNVVAQYNTSNQAVITWNANQEPDVISGGGYNIYREIYYGSTVVSSTQLNSSLLTTTTYTDIDNYLISDVPVGVDLYCRYAVEAVDNTSKVSTKSIFGNIYLGKTVAGSISSNTTWGGSYVMVGDVTINSGTTLTINAGTTIRSSGEIIPGDEETQYNVYNTNVAGKILVNGTATQPVTFCPINGNVPGSWGSLLIYGTGANSSIIDHAIFNNGNLIQVQGASNVTVQNCAISNSLDIALDFSGATNCSALRNTVVNSNAGHGIVMENVSSVTCNQNTIYKSDHNYNGVGIYYGGGSNGNCWQNDIAYYGWGIGAIWGSSPHFFSMENDLRNNRITNCSRGVMIYYDSYPLVGEPYDQYSGNSIFGNGKNISLNYYYSTVSSIGGLDIYWGAVDPYSTFELGTGSHVLLYGVLPLPYDPWDGIDPLYLIKGAQETAQGDQTMQLNKSMNVAVDNSSMALASDAPIIKDIPSEPSLNPLSEGTALLVKGRIIEAKDYFLSYLKKHPNNLEAAARLYNCYSDATAEEIVDYFEKTGSSVEKDNKMMLSYLYLKRGHVDKAKALNSAIIAENPHTPLASNAALSNFYITLYNEKNPMGAGTILNEIESDNAFTTTVELPLARKALKLHSKYASISKSLKKSSKVLMDIPTEFSISQNYPNPFNPSTTISYTLPQASMVTLKVYDMLGREISTLVSEYKSQGRHDVSFNASQLSSGMYIYRIQAGSYIATKKMQLLK